MQLRRVVACCALTVVLVACSGSDDSEGDPARTSSNTQAAGQVFEDPQGSYEIEVDPDWDAHHGTIPAEVEAWFVGESREGFAPNVNILTQLAPGLNLSQFLDDTIELHSSLMDDFELLDREVVDGIEAQLGLLEFTASDSGRSLQFLATVAVRDETAVMATFTAPPNVFDDLRREVEPYLLTLRSA